MASDHTPHKSSRPVFRAEAVKQYVRSREEVILPRYVSRRSIVLLWGALGVIVVGAATLLMVPLPLYTSGTVVAPQGEDQGEGRTGSVTLSIPMDALAQVTPGQDAYLHPPNGPRRFLGRVVAVDGTGASPNDGVGRGARSGEGANRVERPGALVRIQVAEDPDAPPGAACLAHGCRVDIRIGAPRALAFFAPGELRTGK